MLIFFVVVSDIGWWPVSGGYKYFIVDFFEFTGFSPFLPNWCCSLPRMSVFPLISKSCYKEGSVMFISGFLCGM